MFYMKWCAEFFTFHAECSGLESNHKTLPISAWVALTDSNVIKANVVGTLGNLDRATNCLTNNIWPSVG